MKNKAIVSGFVTMTLLTSSIAQAIAGGKVFVPGNKMVEAWEESKLGEASGSDRLPMDPERELTYNFDKAARWEPMQYEFALKSYQHVVKNGFPKDQSRFGKFLGLMALTTGYRYEVEPAFHQGLFTRTDRYFIRPELKGESTIKQLTDDSIVGRLVPGYKVEFAFHRQFSEAKSAILAVPAFDQNLPFNSERALKGLDEGDLFTFKAHLDIVTDFSYLSSLGLGSIGASAGPYFIIDGGFEVHVLRLPENKVRLKVLGVRKQGGGGKVNIGLDALNISGAEVIDDQLTKIALGKNVVKASYLKSLNRLFGADYVLDLNNAEVAQAFDVAMAQARSFEYLEIVDPRNKKAEVAKQVLTNVLELEKLASADGATGIKRIFHGGNESHGSDFEVRIGNKLAGLAGGVEKSTNDIQVSQTERYRLVKRETMSEANFLYSLFRKENKNQTSSVSALDDGKAAPVSFVIYTEVRDKNFSENNFRKAQEKLATALGSIADQIDYSQWNQNEMRRNVVIRSQVVLTDKALLALPEMTREQAVNAYNKYLNNQNSDQRPSQSRQQRQSEALRTIGNELETVFSGGKTLEAKMKALTGLRSSSMFKATGAGFIMSLLSKEEVDTLVRVDVSMSSTDGENLTFGQGPKGPRDLYIKLLYIESLTNDAEIELRLEAETLQ